MVKNDKGGCNTLGRKTWFDLVREYFPDSTDKECDFILLEKTAFPVCGVEEVKRQLEEYAKLES